MEQQELLARRFESDREHLLRIAFRMLGSLAEAEDAVQEAWLRLSRDGAEEVGNVTGWLTTVVSRVCLDVLRSRESRREESFDAAPFELSQISDDSADAADETVLAESVGLALLVVLNALAPAERLAFVLHDMFAMSFDEIGRIIGKSSVAARQLASRARRRVRGDTSHVEGDVVEQRRVVDAFLAALRAGDFDGLVAALAPDFVIRADAFASRDGAQSEVRDPQLWARNAIRYAHLNRFAQLALLDGRVGLVVAPRGKLKRVLVFNIARGKVATIDVIADPEKLRNLDIRIVAIPV